MRSRHLLRKGQVRASARSTEEFDPSGVNPQPVAGPKIAAEAALDQDPPLIHPGVKEHHRSSFRLASAQLNSTSGRLFHKSHPVPNTRADVPPPDFPTHFVRANVTILAAIICKARQRRGPLKTYLML